MLCLILVFEACIGLFTPAIATCRARYIADDIRGTVMGLLRYERVVVVVGFVWSYRGTEHAIDTIATTRDTSFLSGMLLRASDLGEIWKRRLCSSVELDSASASASATREREK